MGPVWDFDFSAGCSDYKDAIKTEGWYVRNTAWYGRMFQDEEFDRAFKNKWKTYRETIFDNLESIIDAKAEELKPSVKFNATNGVLLLTVIWSCEVMKKYITNSTKKLML